MDANIYTQVKASIKQRLKIDLTNYKDEQMKRRLDLWLVRTCGKPGTIISHVLSSDPTELERFRNYLTINVTEFFRDSNRWDILRQEILPYLLKKSSEDRQIHGLKLWSAGCSNGAEAYTLAMMMAEAAPLQKYSLLATDLDRGALLKARSRGPYLAEDIRNLQATQRQKYISAVAPYYVTESLQKHIRFEEQDLLADPFEDRIQPDCLPECGHLLYS